MSIYSNLPVTGPVPPGNYAVFPLSVPCEHGASLPEAGTLPYPLAEDDAHERSVKAAVSKYVEAGMIARAYSVGGSIYGLPDKPESPEVPETDRPGSRLTRPNVTDRDVQLAQYVRLSGLRGIAVLSKRNLTANAIGTRNVPTHLAGAYPDERCNFVPATLDPVTASDLHDCNRYRESMKGERFAEAFRKAGEAINRGWWRNAFPWIPVTTRGTLAHGHVIGGVRFYDVGGEFVSMAKLYNDYVQGLERTDADADAHRTADARLSRKEQEQEELRRLIAEQREDAARQKRGKA